MRKHILRLIAAAAVISAVTMVVWPASTSVSAQGPAAKAGPAPKTAWGDPDLQGIWTDEYQTPLQRPSKYANKEFFTDAERAEFDKQRAGLLGRDNLTVAKGTERDVAGAYNAVFTSVSTRPAHVAGRRSAGRATSALTPKAQKDVAETVHSAGASCNRRRRARRREPAAPAASTKRRRRRGGRI